MLMASSSSNYSLLLLLSSRSPSIPISSLKSPIRLLSPMILHSRRQHPVVVLKEQNGCSIHMLQRNSWFGSIPRRCNKGWGSEGEGDFALETEILEFMDCSENPNKSPTKNDLINAGRSDLDKEEEEEIVQENEDLNSGEVEEDLGSGYLHSDDRMFQERCFNGGECDSLEEVDVGIIASEDSSLTPSSSGREMEKEEEDEAGINGILKRLEKERNETDIGDLSCKNGYEDEWRLGSSMFSDSKPASTPSLKPSNGSYIVSEARDTGKGSISEFDDMGDSLKPDTWRAWSRKREGLSQLDFEAAEVGLDEATDNIVVQKNANETEEERSPYAQPGQNWFRSHFQHLELELASTLQSLKSASEIDISSLKETEVMNAKNKLRSIHAKLAILEGKIALASIESQRNLEMKQNRINVAQLDLSTLCTIVWPNNNASVVLVCGSFDGWTSQRMMERSSSGFFTLDLKLHPGRYELKFIVDGVWKIDPSRPIVHNNGYEKNVLEVCDFEGMRESPKPDTWSSQRQGLYQENPNETGLDSSWRTIYVNAYKRELNALLSSIP